MQPGPSSVIRATGVLSDAVLPLARDATVSGGVSGAGTVSQTSAPPRVSVGGVRLGGVRASDAAIDNPRPLPWVLRPVSERANRSKAPSRKPGENPGPSSMTRSTAPPRRRPARRTARSSRCRNATRCRPCSAALVPARWISNALKIGWDENHQSPPRILRPGTKTRSDAAQQLHDAHLRAQPPTHLAPVDPGQHQIKEHHVVGGRASHPQSIFPGQRHVLRQDPPYENRAAKPAPASPCPQQSRHPHRHPPSPT